MKKTSAILLLCIFSFNLVGLFFIFKAQQYQVRQEIKQHIKKGIPENELTQIIVTPENKNQLNWEHEKEFRYKSEMYDVVKKEIIDGTTILYYCIADNQETTLFANLDEQVKKNMNTKNNGNNPVKNLFKLLSNIYSLPQKYVWILFETNTANTYEYSYYYTSPLLDIASPPPKMG